jgi:hypothetical protein
MAKGRLAGQFEQRGRQFRALALSQQIRELLGIPDYFLGSGVGSLFALAWRVPFA